MSRGVATDYAGFAGTELKLNTAQSNPSVQTAEATDERGDIVARETFEELTAPTTSYQLAADTDIDDIKLGALVDKGTDPDLVITGFSVNTAGGTPPTVDVTCESVPTASVEGYTYTTPTFSLKKNHEAQILFAAFTLTGAGCHVQDCNATASCTLTRALDEDGETTAFDVSGATIEVTATVIQSAATAPTITPAADWTVVTPADPGETNTDYTKHSITLRYTPAAVAPTP